jgi:UDP-4-amino-4,6-dideoxy-N-acetyl-beta-L-altrosamine N-acetyltransferase
MNMHNDQEITWEEHNAWFVALEADKSREFWVLHQDERPIGILNFSGIGTAKLEWGCYLGETNIWPGSGVMFEVAALDRAVAFKDAKLLIAEVLSFNKSAIGLHKLFEYPLIRRMSVGMRDGDSFDKLYYEYPLSQWEKNRGKVLSKLPKSLRMATERIEFRDTV